LIEAGLGESAAGARAQIIAARLSDVFPESRAPTALMETADYVQGQVDFPSDA